MGFWYFLLFFLGVYLMIAGIGFQKQSSFFRKRVFVFTGLLCMSLSVFMFSPGSAEVFADLLKLD